MRYLHEVLRACCIVPALRQSFVQLHALPAGAGACCQRKPRNSMAAATRMLTHTPPRTRELQGQAAVQVASGRYHSVALTADGRVFTW